jgi:hypothetical protein
MGEQVVGAGLIESVPVQVPRVQNVAGRSLRAVVDRHAVEEGAGDVGGKDAGLDGARDELGDLEIAVA